MKIGSITRSIPVDGEYVRAPRIFSQWGIGKSAVGYFYPNEIAIILETNDYYASSDECSISISKIFTSSGLVGWTMTHLLEIVL